MLEFFAVDRDFFAVERISKFGFFRKRRRILINQTCLPSQTEEGVQFEKILLKK